MSNPRLEQQLAFLIEADALKAVERQSRIVKGRRRENSAEHSWHLALFALVLGPERPDIDVSRVVAMLLLHDLVEIDAGDNPMHGAFDANRVAETEDAAAKRLFGLLPDDLAYRFEGLWREFEAAETPDARFARALDRFQPLLLNTLTDGGTWTESDVSEAQVHARYGPVIEKGSPDWWAHARSLVARHFASSDR